MEELEENLQTYQMTDIFESMKSTYIQVSLPKCRLEHLTDFTKDGIFSQVSALDELF